MVGGGDQPGPEMFHVGFAVYLAAIVISRDSALNSSESTPTFLEMESLKSKMFITLTSEGRNIST